MEQVLLYGASRLTMILQIEMVDTRQYSWLLDAGTLIAQKVIPVLFDQSISKHSRHIYLN